MECDRCGAPRPPRGPCPECGAPPSGGPGGSHSSMRQWRDTARTGQGPAAGRGSGASWGPGASGSGSGSRTRGSGADWRTNDGGNGGRDGWDEDGGYGYDDDPPPARSSNRNRRRAQPEYEEVDLERALVPTRGDMMPMDPALMGASVPALPGLPRTDEEERALGIRRPVYIPAIGEKRKKKLGTWRVVSGVLSVMLVCVASCGLAGLVGRDRIQQIFGGPQGVLSTPVVFNTANVPVTPVATPGPAARYVQHVVTATGVDNNLFATGPTSHFTTNSQVYVVISVRGISDSKQHTVSIQWYQNGVLLDLQGALTSKTITRDSQVFFALSYPSPGVGMAKVYWDETGSGTSANDPALADTIYFLVQSPQSGTPSASGTPGTVTPGKTPGKTPAPTSTPTKKSSTGALPVVWRGSDMSGAPPA